MVTDGKKMIKIVVLLVLNSCLVANTFQINCNSCHKNEKELKLFMTKYSLQYSSENNIKKALFRFLRSPSSNRSIMPFEYIQKIGFKQNSILNDKDLKEAINIYYKKYKLNNFIK